MHQTNEEISRLANAAKTYAWGSGGTGLGPFMDNVCAALEQLLAEKAQLEQTIQQVNGRLEHGKSLLRQALQRETELREEVRALRRQLEALQTGAVPAAQQGPDLSRLTAVHQAVSALYFADNSDYKAALQAVVKHLDPELAKLLEQDERAAFVKVEEQLEDAKQSAATEKAAS